MRGRSNTVEVFELLGIQREPWRLPQGGTLSR